MQLVSSTLSPSHELALGCKPHLIRCVRNHRTGKQNHMEKEEQGWMLKWFLRKELPTTWTMCLPLEYLSKAKETSVWFEPLYFCCCYCFICFLVLSILFLVLSIVNNPLDIRKE